MQLLITGNFFYSLYLPEYLLVVCGCQLFCDPKEYELKYFSCSRFSLFVFWGGERLYWQEKVCQQ